MATYFVGTCLDALTPSLTGVTDNGDSIGLYRDVDCYVDAFVTDPADGARKGVPTLWTHATLLSSGITDKALVILFNSAGVPVLQLVGLNNANQVALQWWNGSQFVAAGSAAIGSGDIDIRATVSASAGAVELYFAGARAIGATGLDTSGMVDLAQARFGRMRQGVDDTYWRSVILASYSTMGHVLHRTTATANGTETGWTGDFSGIADSHLNDADSINTNSPGAVATFACSPFPAPAAGNIIKTVAIAARVQADPGAAVQSVRAVVRIAGTDYISAQRVALSGGLAGSVTCLDIDPSTGQAWASASNVAEFGLQAAA